jgi:hypothetical protein
MSQDCEAQKERRGKIQPQGKVASIKSPKKENKITKLNKKRKKIYIKTRKRTKRRRRKKKKKSQETRARKANPFSLATYYLTCVSCPFPHNQRLSLKPAQTPSPQI